MLFLIITIYFQVRQKYLIWWVSFFQPATNLSTLSEANLSVRRGKRGQTFITRFVPLYLPLSGLREVGGGKSWSTLFVAPSFFREVWVLTENFSDFLDGFLVSVVFRVFLGRSALMWEFKKALQLRNSFCFWLVHTHLWT